CRARPAPVPSARARWRRAWLQRARRPAASTRATACRFRRASRASAGCRRRWWETSARSSIVADPMFARATRCRACWRSNPRCARGFDESSSSAAEILPHEHPTRSRMSPALLDHWSMRQLAKADAPVQPPGALVRVGDDQAQSSLSEVQANGFGQREQFLAIALAPVLFAGGHDVDVPGPRDQILQLLKRNEHWRHVCVICRGRIVFEWIANQAGNRVVPEDAEDRVPPGEAARSALRPGMADVPGRFPLASHLLP